MRNVVGLAASAVGLAGCASTQTILEGSADEVAASTKSPEAVAFCIGEKNMSAPFKRQDGSYVISIKSAVGTTGIVYTVMPDGEGSLVEVRRANSPISVTKFRNCL